MRLWQSALAQLFQSPSRQCQKISFLHLRLSLLQDRDSVKCRAKNQITKSTLPPTLSACPLLRSPFPSLPTTVDVVILISARSLPLSHPRAPPIRARSPLVAHDLDLASCSHDLRRSQSSSEARQITSYSLLIPHLITSAFPSHLYHPTSLIDLASGS